MIHLKVQKNENLLILQYPAWKSTNYLTAALMLASWHPGLEIKRLELLHTSQCGTLYSTQSTEEHNHL